MITIDRIELADIANPIKLATAVIDNLSSVSLPIPVREIATALDIIEIKPITTAGFEGGLITPDDKSTGCILVNENNHPRRQRFTIGHELGHYLNPWHKPGAEKSFMCSKKDMIASQFSPAQSRLKMEVEANQFSAELLMPAKLLRADIKRLKAPEIDHVVSLSDKYDVSKESMGRRYVELQDEPCAVIFSKDGKISYTVKGQYFPLLEAWMSGEDLPNKSITRKLDETAGYSSEWEEHPSDIWLKNNQRYESIYEQVLIQEDNRRITLLTLGDEKERDSSWSKPSW